MINAYAKAYTEVLEILSYFSEEEYSKIPKEKLDFYRRNMDKEYIYNINPSKKLSEQYISKEANAILISLFRDYFATETQKKKLGDLLNKNQEQLEKTKKEKYNVDNIFEKEKQEIDENDTINDKTKLIEYKESFLSKLKRFIKNILKK